MTIDITGPDKSSFQFPDGTSEATITAAMAQHYGAPAAAAAPAAPAFDPNDPRFAPHAQSSAAALRGIPLLGAGVEKAGAAVSALAHPLTGVGSDKSSIAERYVDNLAQEEAAKTDYEAKHPVRSAVEGMIGGGLALGGAAGLSGTVAKGLGMVGPIKTAVPAAIASGGALGGADAALRGDDIKAGAETGALTGGLGVLGGKAVGKVWDAARGMMRDAPVVPRTMDVNGRAVPIDKAIETGTAADSTTKQALIHQSDPKTAQIARDAMDATDQGLRGTVEDFKASVAPPAQAAPHTARTAAEELQSALQQGNADSRAGVKAAYDAAGAAPGEYTPSLIQNTPKVVRAQLGQGDKVILDDLTPRGTSAMGYLDKELGQMNLTTNAAAEPRPRMVSPAIEDDVAALRSKFGDTVAEAYAKQKSQPQPLSLLEFIASKGGLKPHPELDAIGLGHGHRSQIPGQSGFFGTVRKNGSEIDRMREAAQEAGYLRGAHDETSTPAQFLDAIDAELRGQKKYPEGFEGFSSKKATGLRDARETAEIDQVMRGYEKDLADAGHGELGPDMRKRAAALMHEEGMSADNAVEHAFRQLEQEDAFGVAAGFPGDRARPITLPHSAEPITPNAIEQVRKNLNRHLQQAQKDGNAADIRAVNRIKEAFDNHITNVTQTPGGFTGDAAEVLRLQAEARAAHATHKQNYSAQAPGDLAGRTIENIIGKRGVAPLDVESITPKIFGSPNNPGGGVQATLVRRLTQTLGPNSPTLHALRQGVFSHAADMLPGMMPVGHKVMADRVTKLLESSLGKELFTDAQQDAMRNIANAYRRVIPVPGTTNPPGSGHVMVRGMKAMARSALPIIGAATHGPAGFAAGLAGQKAGTAIAERSTRKAAERFFQGERGKRSSLPRLPESLAPQRFGALGGLLAADRQSR